jgi:hypothetical protein
MIAMSPTITLKGSYKFSMKKLVAGGEMGYSTFTGPGELLLGPPFLGDVTSLRLTGSESWSVGYDGYLASTQGVIKEYKRQGIGKAMFSGEGLFVYKISGVGLLWLTSFGAIIRKDVSFSQALAPFLSLCAACADVLGSLWTERSTSSTTGTWSRGTLSTSWNGLRPAVSSPVSHRRKGSCASSLGRAPSLSRQEML